jgi:hypothetical protein
MTQPMPRTHEGQRHVEARVIIRLGDPVPSSQVVIAAAIHLARAFGCGVEGLFIEDRAIFAAAAYAGATEISMTGAGRRKISEAQINHDLGHFGVAMQRQLSQASRSERVPFSARVVREDVIVALTKASATGGPGNIIAFSEPITTTNGSELVAEAIETVAGARGFLVGGRTAAWRAGPILIAIESVETMLDLTRVGQRIAALTNEPVWLLPVGEDEIALDWLESEIRLALADRPSLHLLRPVARLGHSQTVWAACATYNPRLIVAGPRGLVMPVHEIQEALSHVGAPVFLVT